MSTIEQAEEQLQKIKHRLRKVAEEKVELENAISVLSSSLKDRKKFKASTAKGH